MNKMRELKKVKPQKCVHHKMEASIAHMICNTNLIGSLTCIVFL